MTETIGIYYQTKDGTIKLYCEDCKPAGTSHHGTLVVSTNDHFCNGCGKDFKDIAEGTVFVDPYREFANYMTEAQEQAAWDNHQMGY